MKTSAKISLIFCLVLLLCSWTTKPTVLLAKASWLLGTWENKTSRGIMYENWSKKSAAEYAGKSYKLHGQDTILLETVRLLQEQDSLFYIPTVSNQNDGLPVRFNLKEATPSKLIFFNAAHDFPQYISYTRISADSLVADIYGTLNGKEQKRSFPMRRIR